MLNNFSTSNATLFKNESSSIVYHLFYVVIWTWKLSLHSRPHRPDWHFLAISQQTVGLTADPFFFFFLSPIVRRIWFTALTAMSITRSRVVLMFLFPLPRPAYILNVKPFFFCLIKKKFIFCLLWNCCRGQTSAFVSVAKPNGAVKKQISQKMYFLVTKCTSW